MLTAIKTEISKYGDRQRIIEALEDKPEGTPFLEEFHDKHFQKYRLCVMFRGILQAYCGNDLDQLLIRVENSTGLKVLQ